MPMDRTLNASAVLDKLDPPAHYDKGTIYVLWMLSHYSSGSIVRKSNNSLITRQYASAAVHLPRVLTKCVQRILFVDGY